MKRHEGHRQTACIRYMSAPQRSHFMAASLPGVDGDVPKAETTGLTISFGAGFEDGESTPAL
ncbi:MAG: hypothetical protein FJW22_14850 [Acidimicrobiia bacterium]|nr:hypothetical protein [Acidimicrobiia bacterium]